MTKKSKIVISLTLITLCAVIVLAVFFINKNKISYGKYSADTFNGNESYIILDQEHISFSNINFESAEHLEAVIQAFNEKDNELNTDSETQHEHTDEETSDSDNNAFMNRVSEIQKTLNFSSIFNNNTFDATDYVKQEDGSQAISVYDEESDTEIYIVLNPKEKQLICGELILNYCGA